MAVVLGWEKKCGGSLALDVAVVGGEWAFGKL